MELLRVTQAFRVSERIAIKGISINKKNPFD